MYAILIIGRHGRREMLSGRYGSLKMAKRVAREYRLMGANATVVQVDEGDIA